TRGRALVLPCDHITSKRQHCCANTLETLKVSGRRTMKTWPPTTTIWRRSTLTHRCRYAPGLRCRPCKAPAPEWAHALRQRPTRQWTQAHGSTSQRTNRPFWVVSTTSSTAFRLWSVTCRSNRAAKGLPAKLILSDRLECGIATKRWPTSRRHS